MSVSFGRQNARKAHLLRGSGGLGPEIADLRNDAERAFDVLESGAGFPSLDVASSSVVDSGSGIHGVANSVNTTLTLEGAGLEAGLGRDWVQFVNAAANSDFRIVSLLPGDGLVDIAIGYGAADALLSRVTSGRTEIIITIDNDGATPPSDIKALVDANAIASAAIAVVGAPTHTGAGVIANLEITTAGYTAVLATATYHRLGTVADNMDATATTTATDDAGTGRVQVAAGSEVTFSYGGVTTAARFNHTSVQYAIDQSTFATEAALEEPSDGFMSVLVDGDNAAFTGVLTPGRSYRFDILVDGARTSVMLPYLAGTSMVLAGVDGVVDAVEASAFGVSESATTVLTLHGSGFEGGKGRDSATIEVAAANGDFAIHAISPGLSNVQIAIFDAAAGGGVTCTYTLIGGVHSIHFLYDSGHASRTATGFRAQLAAEPTARGLIAITGAQGHNGTGVFVANEANTTGATAVAATSPYVALGALTAPNAASVVLTTGTGLLGAYTFEYAGLTTLFIHDQNADGTLYPVTQAGSLGLIPSDGILMVEVDGSNAASTFITTQFQQYNFRLGLDGVFSSPATLTATS
jgi:hypothetical protein